MMGVLKSQLGALFKIWFTFRLFYIRHESTKYQKRVACIKEKSMHYTKIGAKAIRFPTSHFCLLVVIGN